MTTPDTELDKKKFELKFGGKLLVDSRFEELIDYVDTLITSRDTYWKEELEKAKKEQRERDVYLIRTSGWHTAEKLARRIFGGEQINWYTDKQMEGAREQVREERDTYWKERVRDKREALAELEHIQWIAWSKNIAETEQITPARLERWKKLWRPYAELTETEKDQDREWADKALDTLLDNLK